MVNAFQALSIDEEESDESSTSDIGGAGNGIQEHEDGTVSAAVEDSYYVLGQSVGATNSITVTEGTFPSLRYSNNDENQAILDHDASDSPELTSSSSSRLTSILSNNNWRRPSDEDDAGNFANSRDETRYRSDSRNYAHRRGPKTPRGVFYDDLYPGVIIWCWDIRTCPDATKFPTWYIYVEKGKQMMKKGRYFVIVKKVDLGNGKFELGLNGIYTNNDTGLENTHEFNHHKYFSLCPMEIDVDDFENLNSDNPVLQIKWKPQPRNANEADLTRLTMTVNWSKLFKRDIHIEELRIVGILTDESRDALCSKPRDSRSSK